MTSWPAVSTPCTWKTDLAMSNPIVVTVCMDSSSESWEPQQRPHPWHSRAGGGAVHSINCRQTLLKSLQEKLIKINAKVICYNRYRPPRHAVRRGIQRGTLMRNASYSAPNDFLSVGSS